MLHHFLLLLPSLPGCVVLRLQRLHAGGAELSQQLMRTQPRRARLERLFPAVWLPHKGQLCQLALHPTDLPLPVAPPL